MWECPMPPPDPVPDPVQPVDPSLVLDRRKALTGKPGLHAILIGVSDYPHLPAADEPGGDGLAALKKLESPALSALRLHDKLIDLDADQRLPRPVKTIRMLNSPSPTEIAKEPALEGKGIPATRLNIKQALKAWRQDV